MDVQKTSLKQKIHDGILGAIINGEYPLDGFLSERELIARFEVSKAPVREALVELCNEKVLRSIPRLGYQIIQLTETDVREATELRLLIEIPALKKAFTTINNRNLEKIRQVNKEHEDLKKNKSLTVTEHWESNIQFHLLLNSFADNNMMSNYLNSIMRLLWRAYAQLYTNSSNKEIEDDIDRHIMIVNALENKELDRAVELLREDIIFIIKQLYISSKDIF